MTVSAAGKAIITGASCGIGSLYADRLAARGYDLILVGRDRVRLASLRESIFERYGRPVALFAADPGDRQALRPIEQLLRTDNDITMLINNCGVAAMARSAGSDADVETRVQLDPTALMRLTCAAVPSFLARGAGAIVNIGRIVRFGPERHDAVYDGARAFATAFGGAAHHGLPDHGIRIQVVLPGAVTSGFWNVAGRPAKHLPAHIVGVASAMVDAALAGSTRADR